MPTSWLHWIINGLTDLAPAGTIFSLSFNVRGLLAVVLVSLVCGAVGSLVIGKRMAFFSDALAHCAFAGVALGTLSALLVEIEVGHDYRESAVPMTMVAFGVLVGVLIAFVRERTGLASDTVIGVFFAGAIGFGAMLFKSLSNFGYFNLEAFLFGDPVTAREEDLAYLLFLTFITFVVLGFMYNQLVFASFNPSLARSRNVSVSVSNYVFIVLLALIVNLSIRAVGALLINALLIVPAATAALLCRNLRQMFWGSLLLSMTTGIVGVALALEIHVPLGGRDLTFGIGGMIVVLSVLLFFVAMVAAPRVQRRSAASEPAKA